MLSLALAASAQAQVDQVRAASYFAEAAALCARDGGRLWAVSLCGPMVFADPVTRTLATNQPAPPGDWPRALGFANAAIDWGGVRWSTYVWQAIPAQDERARKRLLMHELFHRVQNQLGFLVAAGANDHLDTADGRYWMRLEWRALARALGAQGAARDSAVRDALAFRARRRTMVPSASESERADEIREGLAQYTGTVLSVNSADEATASALEQLQAAEEQPTYVRTFAYPSGAAYGVLLDKLAPGWTRQVKPTTDLGALLLTAVHIRPADNAAAAAARYDGAALRIAEEQREVERQARVAELRKRFVEGPVMTIPRGRGATFRTTGATPLPGSGTVFMEYRVSGEWGSFETTTGVLVATDGSTLSVPAPQRVDDATIVGDGWKLVLATGWAARTGARGGDYVIARSTP